MKDDINHILLWRAVTVLGVILAFLLVLLIPMHMQENTDWAFQYSVVNFSKGQLSVDMDTLSEEAAEASSYGGTLNQYVQVNDGRWVLTTEAPGYIFFLLPFYYIHAPELGSLLLAGCVILVVYLLLKFLRDEKTACLGSLLVLFNPVSLALMQRVYIDSYGAFAFLSAGGGLYIYYFLRRRELSPLSSAAILFLAGISLGWSVFAGYYNALPVGVFVLHFIYTCARSFVSGQVRQAIRTALWLCLGFIIPIAGLLVYQNSVFGSPWSFGFQYAQFNTIFSPKLIYANLLNVSVALLTGFPLLLPGFAAIWTAFSVKVKALKTRNENTAIPDKWTELSLDILLLVAGWIAAVFGLYLCYEGTATSQVASMPIIVMARYYLPALLPLTLMAVLLLKHMPRKLSLTITVLSLAWGVIFFAQSALSYWAVPEHNPYNQTESALPEKTDCNLVLSELENNCIDIEAEWL